MEEEGDNVEQDKETYDNKVAMEVATTANLRK
jgi:hypothetical protein